LDQPIFNVCGYIYKITNLVNYKIYIGQTIKTIDERWYEHIWYSKNKSNIHLYNSIKKYGIKNFKIKELLKCYNQEDLDFFEDYYIVVWDTMNPEKGYNKMRGGWGFHSFSSEINIRRTESYKKYLSNPDNKNKIIERNRKISKTVKEYSNRPKVKKEFKERMEIWFSDPKNKEKHRKATKEAMNRPEIKEKHRKAVKEGRKKYCKKRSIKYENAKQENDFINMKYDDLYELAIKYNIFRRKSMNKHKLIDNLQKIQ